MGWSSGWRTPSCCCEGRSAPRRGRDLEQAQELVNDARSACDQWLALSRAHHGTSQAGETSSTAARAE